MQSPTFQLPDFLRSAWVSDRAREVWKPRFERIRNTWPSVAIQTVSARAAGCTLRTLPSHMFFRVKAEASRHGVAAVALGVRGLAVPAYGSDLPLPKFGRPFLYHVALGTPQSCHAIEELWEQHEYADTYRLSGSPECCVAALAGDIESHRIDSVSRYVTVDECTKVNHGAVIDPLWSWLNIDPCACAPCTLHCDAKLVQRIDWISAAEDCGFRQEMEWLREIFSWPLEWSALHGIAELKTPILKASWTTDAMHQKVVLRYRGQGYPREGAIGLHFPYRLSTRPALTSSKAFQRGMDNLVQIG